VPPPLLDDQGRSEAAIECLRKALRVAPDYVDASRRCYNAKINMRRPQITGAAFFSSDCQNGMGQASTPIV
jgi:hypothetical protein